MEELKICMQSNIIRREPTLGVQHPYAPSTTMLSLGSVIFSTLGTLASRDFTLHGEPSFLRQAQEIQILRPLLHRSREVRVTSHPHPIERYQHRPIS